MTAPKRPNLRPRLEPLESRLVPATTLIRSVDGTGNNLSNPEWGSTNEAFLRNAPAAYADGVSAAAGATRPSARAVSNALAAHAAADTPDERDLTAYIYLWGQFLDHDIDLTASGTEKLNIAVPTGDPSFDPTGTGTQVIPFTRSAGADGTGTGTGNPLQQLNKITAWIDGSMIYGSDEETANSLRTFSGGHLKVTSSSAGDLPPTDDDGSFLAGDERANENIELTSMHTLFLREHNRVADRIAAANPGLSDEEIYQQARAWVIAEIQVITYKEWLPALIGNNAMPAYRGYNPAVNPGIANEFATAGFRLHTTINDDVEFFGNDGRPLTFDVTGRSGATETIDGEVSLADAFFNPGLFAQTGADGILKYAASTHAERLDNQVVDSLRNFLFGAPGSGGLDLASLNIQRGRDHGLADYNTTRAAYGLPKVTSFAQITSDTAVQQKLQALYGDVNNIDLWAGAMAEDHVAGSSTGALVQRIVVDQFRRLRDGDRFWYQNQFSGSQLAELEGTTLGGVIRANTGVQNLQGNVFFFKAQVQGRVFQDANGNGRADGREAGLAGVTVQLLNDEGEVIATATTDRQGGYAFRSLPETGDYSVQVVPPARAVATTATTAAVSISRGDSSPQVQDFGVRTPTAPAPVRRPARTTTLVARRTAARAAARVAAQDAVFADPNGLNR